MIGLFRASAIASLAAASSLAAAERVAITGADCARVVAHAPAPDVAYRPGVDVEGGAVVPADLADNVDPGIGAGDVAVEIAVPLRAFPGIPGDETQFTAEGGAIDRFEATANVGAVTVRDGLVYFDGRLISSRERELLAAACSGR